MLDRVLFFLHPIYNLCCNNSVLGLVRIQHKIHLVRLAFENIRVLAYLVLSAKTWLEISRRLLKLTQCFHTCSVKQWSLTRYYDSLMINISQNVSRNKSSSSKRGSVLELFSLFTVLTYKSKDVFVVKYV